jgi:hypothetical protein
MIEFFPAKCDEILRYGGSVWADIVMKHHNIPAKHISENEVYQTQFREEVALKFVESTGKMTKR